MDVQLLKNVAQMRMNSGRGQSQRTSNFLVGKIAAQGCHDLLLAPGQSPLIHRVLLHHGKSLGQQAFGLVAQGHLSG